MISIIIPVYNTSKYLPECLDSVISQTYSDLEIILVDDGSTDESPLICDVYSEKDKRISVFHTKNSGVSSARNFGIAQSHGDFIMFIDSDDYVADTFCERMITIQNKEKTDYIICAHWNVSSKETISKQIYNTDCNFYGDDYRRNIMIKTLGLIGDIGSSPFQLDILTPVWARLYKAKIIKEKKLQFFDLSLLPSECQQFNFEYTVNASSASYLAVPMYYYRRNTVSSLTKPYRENLFDKWQWWCNYDNTYISEKCESPDIRQAYYGRICCSVIPLCRNALKAGSFFCTKKEVTAFLSNKIYRESFSNFSIKNWPLYWRIYFGTAKYRLVVFFILFTKLASKALTRRHR